MAIAALVLGIISLVFSFIGPVAYVGTICGIVGTILGAVGRQKDPANKGMATAGLVMSIISIALSVCVYLACVACVVGMGSIR